MNLFPTNSLSRPWMKLKSLKFKSLRLDVTKYKIQIRRKCKILLSLSLKHTDSTTGQQSYCKTFDKIARREMTPGFIRWVTAKTVAPPWEEQILRLGPFGRSQLCLGVMISLVCTTELHVLLGCMEFCIFHKQE